MSKGKEDEDKKKEVEWTEDRLRDRYSFELLADKLDTLTKEKSERETRYIATLSTHDRRIVYVMLTFLSVVIGAMALLTWRGQVGGESLLFAVGITIGYIFAFIQRFIFPPRIVIEESSE